MIHLIRPNENKKLSLSARSPFDKVASLTRAPQLKGRAQRVGLGRTKFCVLAERRRLSLSKPGSQLLAYFGGCA